MSYGYIYMTENRCQTDIFSRSWDFKIKLDKRCFLHFMRKRFQLLIDENSITNHAECALYKNAFKNLSNSTISKIFIYY